MATYTIYNPKSSNNFTSKKMTADRAIEAIESEAELMVLNGWEMLQELTHYPSQHRYGIRMAKMDGDRILENCHLFVSL